MDISNLWETVVLRDILGYVFPGTITALALALMVSTVLGAPLSWQLLEELSGAFGWAFVATVLAVGYVVGHTQARLLALVELILEKTPLSRDNLAAWALGRHSMGGEYEAAATQYFGGSPWVDAAEPAWQMWRLCDYHVLHRAPHLHRTYMGTYNVLYVLFGNLSATAVLVWFAIAVSMEWRAWTPGPQWEASQISLLATVSVLSVLALPFLVCWAHRFRKDFMIRVFPTFYAVTTRERRRSPDTSDRRDSRGRSWVPALLGLGVGLILGRGVERRARR